MQEETVDQPASQSFRLSPQQRHLWTRVQEGDVYRAQCALAVDGPLDPAVCRAALQSVVDRHEILRTAFPRRPGLRFPVQQVAERGTFEWREDSSGRLDGLMREERERPYDPEGDAPLRAALAVREDGSRALVLTLPALCADARTLVLLAEEIATALAGGSPTDEPVQHCAFSEWQHELLESEEDAAAGAAFWRARRTGEAGPPALPESRPEVAGATLEAALVERLEAAVRARGCSLEMLLLTAWQALFWRLGQVGDVPVGYAADGRSHEDLAGTLGPLTRHVPVSARFEDTPLLAAALDRVSRATAEARGWQEHWSQEVAGPLPATGFDFQEWPAVLPAGGLSLAVLRQHVCLDRFEIRLSAWRRRGGSLHLDLHHDPSRTGAEAARRLAVRLRLLLEGIAADPSLPLDHIGLLDGDEFRRLVVDFNAAAPWPEDLCAHQLFARQAARTPDRVAVRAGAAELTYAGLARSARRLALRLRELGVGPESLVAVHCERSLEMVVAILGVLEAGGAFLPLDPGHPPERLSMILEDARPRVLLTAEGLLGSLPDPRPPHVLPVEIAPDGGAPGATGPELRTGVGPENLAYVIHTSGSTGRPKGVLVPHRGLVHYLAWCSRAYGAAEGDVTPVHSPIGFDLTFTSLFVPLVTGGTAFLLPEAPGGEALAAALAGDLGLVKLTPSHLELLARSAGVGNGGRVGVFVVGGEALRGELLAGWRRERPETRFVNEYGPTETVVGCVVYEVPAGEVPAGPVPIGRPIDDMRVYVLDRHLRPVPSGVTGELYIGGPGVARGYLDRPDSTAEKMVPDPLGDEPGARLYRTGDLARHLEDGNLEFLGRYDHQVKVRGHRIELGEVEAALLRLPGVREAVAAARPDASGDLRLVAYLALPPGMRPKSAELRQLLAGHLPEAMIPSFFVALDALPLTPNGKVDRAALPDPGSARGELDADYVAPRNEVERRLAAIWGEVLGYEGLGIHDSFFALGGDSIRSVRAVAQAREQGLVFSVQDLFQHQTVARLAEFLGGSAEAAGEDDEDLAGLLDELEALSDEEAAALIRARTGEAAP